MWLVDTCVLSELAKARPEPKVLDWIAAHGEQSWVAAVSLGEFGFGMESLPQGARRNALAHWFERLRQQFEGKLLVTDEQVWLRFGQLKASLRTVGRPQDDFDLLIGATASVHGLSLVTRNTRHFKDMGLPLLDPWK